MSNSIQQYIASKLEQRKTENNFRSLKVADGLIDFYSNDYLGFARDNALKTAIEQEIKNNTNQPTGSTGSRLLSGNNAYVEALEAQLAAFHASESALLFNSGFDANYGLLSTLPYRGDTIIYDELAHASFHDGMRSSKASSIAFKHNDVADLEEKLKAATGLKYVVVESVYSMDGDIAPLTEISALCKKYSAGLIVDEAHAIGTQGAKGEGLATGEIETLARVYTFGKAMGTHGAVVVCNQQLKEFLINYCRPFIYSTALPLHTLAAIKCAYQLVERVNDRRIKLLQLATLLQQQLHLKQGFEYIASTSPIQSIIVPGNSHVKQFALQLQQTGFDVRAILVPTVPKGKERIRICLHSYNTEQEVTKLAETINNL